MLAAQAGSERAAGSAAGTSGAATEVLMVNRIAVSGSERRHKLAFC